MKKHSIVSLSVNPESIELLDWIKNAPDDALLTRRQATMVLNMSSERFLEDAARKGTGPCMVRISKSCVRYKLGDLRRWIASRTVLHSSQEIPI